MKAKGALLGFTLLAAFEAYYWQFKPAALSITPSPIDSTLFALEVQQFDDEGRLTNRLESPRVDHLPQGNVHVLLSPKIQLTQGKEAPWMIKAQEAKAYGGGERIVFRGQVLAHQALT